MKRLLFVIFLGAALNQLRAQTLTCSPSTITGGQSASCAVTLGAGATSAIAFSVNDTVWSSVTPDGTGAALTTISFGDSAPGNYTVAFNYPGDGSISAASGTAQVTIASSSSSGSGTTIYSYSIADQTGASGYAANGNVNAYTDLVNGTWSLGYDSLNRLSSSTQTTPTTQPQYGCWADDSFGNTWQSFLSDHPLGSATSSSPCQPATGATTYETNISYNLTNNQISSGTWRDSTGVFNTGSPQYGDGRGNITQDLQNSYLFDAEGHVCAVQNAAGVLIGYLYDADGARVAKGSLTAFTCDPTKNGLQVTASYIVGPDGQEMTQSDGSGTWVHTNVSAAGRFVGTYQPDGLHFQLTDWVGTKRAQTDFAGNVEETCTSQPYGDSLVCSKVTSASQRHFTGKERDTESGLDYFGARYYGSSMGRFTSPDDGSDQDPSDPQSWNLYSYVRNNPLTHTDSDGRSVNVCTNDASGNQQCKLLSNDQYTAAQQGNGSLNVPTLDQVGSNGNGSGQFNSTSITDSNGNTVGSATYVSDGRADYYANANGYQQLSNTSQVVKAGTAVYAGFYSAVGAAIAGPPVAAAAWRFILQRLALSATSPALIEVVNKLYQETDEISGGTAGAVRNELTTGQYLNTGSGIDGSHLIKASNTINELTSLIKSGELDGHNQMIAEHLISDLKNSLGR